MSHAKHALGSVVAILLASAACSSSDDTAMSEGVPPDGSTSQDAGGTGNEPGAPTASGVLLVHAAAFPSFRLCFSNFPDLAPQPDSNVMPEANVVGVEVGSLVRVDPMLAPGTVYVIRESEVRSTPGETNPVKCGELLLPPGQKTDRSLLLDSDYHVATVIDRPLGQDQVSVLAITGCGNQVFLSDLGLSSASCGAGWDVVHGNLQAKVVDLRTTVDGATATRLPVQLFHMSQALDAFNGDGGTAVSVSYGELAPGADPLGQPVPGGTLFVPGMQTALRIDQTDPAIYGTHGFRVTAKSGSATFSTDQSLAAVQELSSPRELPTSYYRAASNYALLLLGDPTHAPTFADGGANPLYNPRQSVHLLAVPVLDPSKADAGPDAGPDAEAPGSTNDGGT
jgi:hypothetical protein